MAHLRIVVDRQCQYMAMSCYKPTLDPIDANGVVFKSLTEREHILTLCSTYMLIEMLTNDYIEP